MHCNILLLFLLCRVEIEDELVVEDNVEQYCIAIFFLLLFCRDEIKDELVVKDMLNNISMLYFVFVV